MRIISDDSQPKQTAPSVPPAQQIIKTALHVYHALGGGMTADIYRQCVYEELKQSGALLEKDVVMALSYRDLTIEGAVTVDFIVDNQVVVLVRTGGNAEEFELELRSVLRLSGKEEGYLFNFRVPDIRKGILHAKIKAPDVVNEIN